MTKTLLQWILLVYFSGIVASEGQAKSLRVVHKLVGGHLSLNKDDDIELMASGGGDGKNSKKKTSNTEEKKTLAQQVADGKYALIQTELFSKPIKKPGVISYRENGEVPHDTINNLGGLNKSDIWLSENHLLVIKGGSYPPYTPQTLETEVWPAIDDYNAPGRQVKIPAHPKVPPPFPVQLRDDGPLLLLGTNASKTLNGTFPQAVRPLFPEENYVSAGGEPPGYAYRHPSNASSGETPFPIAPFPPSGLDFYDPYKEGSLNGSVPIFPFVGPENLPSLDNVTYDEDDPSIYYPPRYSFYYEQDNTTQVPPGPLVPGIILPPPPNFFAPFEVNIRNKTNEDKIPTTTFKPSNTYEPRTIYKLKSETTSTTTTLKPTVQSTTQFSSGLPTLVQNISIPKTTTPAPRKPPTVSNFRKKYPTITILKAITTTIPRVNKEGGRSFKIQFPPANTKTVVTTTRVPLKSYYTSTHIEQPSNGEAKKQYVNEVIVNIPKPKETTSNKPAAQYYYYEENAINTTPRSPKPQREYNVPEYFVPAREVDVVINEQPPPQQNIRYYFVNNNLPPEIPTRPRKPPNTFSIHIARLRDQIHTYETALRNNDYYQRPVYRPIPKPVYQYSFESTGYPNQRNRYYQPEYRRPVENPNKHYNVEIQEAIEVTTPRPVYETTQNNYYYSQSVTDNPRKHNEQSSRTKSKPISEYSFEATPNPIFQQLYTKHDEPYIDDVTKEYFTVFGKKLPVATTPIPTYSRGKYVDSRSQSQVENKPITLESDTFVNYLRPNQQINPNAEYIEDARYGKDRIQNRPHENYQSNVRKLEEERPYVSYKLPGDEGTHFYFITPKLAQKREQNASYFYSS